MLSIFLIGLDLITITRINRTFSLDLEDDDSCVYLHGTFLAGARRRLAFQLRQILLALSHTSLNENKKVNYSLDFYSLVIREHYWSRLAGQVCRDGA